MISSNSDCLFVCVYSFSFTVGIGSSVDKRLCTRLSEMGNGKVEFVRDSEDDRLQRKVIKLLKYALHIQFTCKFLLSNLSPLSPRYRNQSISHFYPSICWFVVNLSIFLLFLALVIDWNDSFDPKSIVFLSPAPSTQFIQSFGSRFTIYMVVDVPLQYTTVQLAESIRKMRIQLLVGNTTVVCPIPELVHNLEGDALHKLAVSRRIRDLEQEGIIVL